MGTSNTAARKGARRLADVPPIVRAALDDGTSQSVNLMEWLATDMSALALVVANYATPRLSDALREAAVKMRGAGVIARMQAGGAAIASSVDLEGAEFARLAGHPSDAVRQWACYAVCDPAAGTSVERRLQALMRFADDANMSVREAAWLAFRPTVAKDVEAMISRLTDAAGSPIANVRRFAVEVTRPRSVWGAHLPALKRRPETARPLLEKVKADSSRYVQLAVGNWLNDASRTRPDWVAEVAAAWSVFDDRNTAFMVKRGTRTLTRLERTGVAHPSGSISTLFAIGEAA